MVASALRVPEPFSTRATSGWHTFDLGDGIECVFYTVDNTFTVTSKAFGMRSYPYQNGHGIETFSQGI